MKKCAVLLFAIALTAATVVGCSSRKTTVNAQGQTVTGPKAETLDRMQQSSKVLQEIMNAPDSEIPAEVLKSAKCVAIVPSMVKGGFVVGGQHGRGVATCRTPKGWSAPAFFTLTGGSWGAQIGAEAVDLVMLIMNDQGMQQLLSNQFALGAAGSVAAGPVGRSASASTDWKMSTGVLTYSRTRGLFAGLDLHGAVVKPDEDSTVAFYGKNLSFSDTLTGKVATPAAAQTFVSSVRQAFHEAKQETSGY
jgi:SH3 domain-containing YSC84-like protein 1